MIEFPIVDGYTGEPRQVQRKGKMYPVAETYVVELFTVQVMAEALGRKVPAIKKLESEGFPLPMFHVKEKQFRGRPIRYYSGAQILLSHLLQKKHGGASKNSNFDKKGFITELRALFYSPGLEVSLQTNTITIDETP